MHADAVSGSSESLITHYAIITHYFSMCDIIYLVWLNANYMGSSYNGEYVIHDCYALIFGILSTVGIISAVLKRMLIPSIK